MENDEATARERGLEKAAFTFPDEIVAAIAVARAQCDALAAMPIDLPDPM